MNVKGTKKKNQVVKVNIFEQQEIISKAEVIMRNLKVILSTISAVIHAHSVDFIFLSRLSYSDINSSKIL